MRNAQDDYRVLLLPATRRDAFVTSELLQQAGMDCIVCHDAHALARRLEAPCGAILLTDTAFQDRNIDDVLRVLSRQSPWSDIPTIVLCHTAMQPEISAHILKSWRNVTVLERPTSSRTLVSSVKAAIRARERQYQMREQFNRVRNSEAALKSASEALTDANRRKDEFLAMLAHELRNPLAPVRNAAEILERKLVDDPRLRSPVDVIKRQVNHLARLVDDLLDVSRINEGRIDLRRAPHDIRAIVTQAIESVEPLVRDKVLNLESDLGDVPLFVDGDRDRLVQSVANILTNAAKYTDRGGRIHLQIERQGTTAAVAVSDNGVGIAPELLPRVFDLFVQGDRTLDRSQGGLGIGLSVVRRLIEMHDGRVNAFSDGPGRGSRFELTLPLIDAPPESTAQVPGTPPSRKRILIVDDNEDAADSLAELLKIEGHETEAVYSARNALERAIASNPQVILLDIGLPDMNGYEVATRIRETLKSVQIIALTGYGQSSDVQRAMAVGFDAHMIKPVEFEALGRLIGAGRPEPCQTAG